MKNSKNRWMAMGSWLLGAVVLVGMASCGRPVPAEAEVPAAAVETWTVTSNPRDVVEEVVGTVRTKTRAVVEAKVSGRIAKLPVVLGQTVKAGDVLAEIDAQEIRARYEQAKAQRDQAERDLERATTLMKRQVSSRQEFDAAEARFRVAEGALSEAQTMLSYARVTAPFDGVVARKLAEVGDLAAPGKPLLEVEDRGTLRFEADVPEALIGGVSSGQKIDVTIPSAKKTLVGEVVEVSPTADAASRTYFIKLDLPADAALRAGQFGRAAIPVGTADSIRIPASAVVERGQIELVFVNREGAAILRLVRTGKRIGSEVEILAGLEAGESVITTGAGALVDGQPVREGK